MRTQEQIEKDIAKTEQEKQEILSSIEILQHKTTLLRDELVNLRNELFANYGKPKDIKFLIDNYDPCINDPAIYKALTEWCKLYTLNHFGYTLETLQPRFSVCIERDGSNIKKTLKGLNLLLPHLKPTKNGNLNVGIFDYMLSEYDSYSIDIYPDFSKAIVLGYYKKGEEFEGSLEDTLKYVKKYHWYD